MIQRGYLRRSLVRNKKPILIMCIGSDKVVFDSYGPLVGSLLLENKEILKAISNNKIKVIGSLDDTLNGINFKSVISKYKLSDYNVIVFDSSVKYIEGEEEESNTLIVKKGGIQPGKSLGKELEMIGDISVLFSIGISIDKIKKFANDKKKKKSFFDIFKRKKIDNEDGKLPIVDYLNFKEITIGEVYENARKSADVFIADFISII